MMNLRTVRTQFAAGGALDRVELVGAVELARIGVGILVRHLDGAEHELATRLAVVVMS